MTPALTLEAMLAGAGFADVPASPLQRAICRAAEGRPIGDALSPDDCHRYFGCAPDELPSERARRVVLVCGVRGGKTLLSCCYAITAALAADLRSIKPHELPRFALIAPTVDHARAAFVQLCGIVQSSKVLRAFLDGEPTADTVTIRRPDGRRVEIVVVAAHRGGLSVRARWLVGALLDEVASFGSESTGAVVNAEEILRAAETRLLPGCQVWLVSSPFGPVGLLHDLYKDHFGRPNRTLVVHAPTRALNPSFPQERVDEIRAESPDVAAREYDAQWVDADSAFLPAVLIDRATRAEPLTKPGRATSAAMDPATRGNDWTLAVAWSEADGGQERTVVGGVWRWQGSKQEPLSPREVLGEIRRILRPYGIETITVDGWSFDALNDHAKDLGLSLALNDAKQHPYYTLRTALSNGALELPPDPLMRQDLLAIRQRATSSGTTLHLPRTADGRHCDFAPAVALAVHNVASGGMSTEGMRAATATMQSLCGWAGGLKPWNGPVPW